MAAPTTWPGTGYTPSGPRRCSSTRSVVCSSGPRPRASFLLNVPDGATRRDIIGTMPWWGGVIGFYLQDSWKVTNRFTVNMGLRYDRTLIPTAGTDDRSNNFAGDMNYLNGTYILQRMAPPCG